MPDFTFAEFFSGGGMARAGLGDNWNCVLANDIDRKKCDTYRMNWSSDHLLECDVAELPNSYLEKNIDLYWASSPCQDFSLAGSGGGLSGGRSSAFLPWMEKVKTAFDAGYPPKIIAFENVVGLLSANQGRDFQIVLKSIADLGYQVGAIILDAKSFLPQSRPRLFVIGVRDDIRLPQDIIAIGGLQHAQQIRKAFDRLGTKAKANWVWWDIAKPTKTELSLIDIVQDNVDKDFWFSKAKIQNLISLMNETHKQKLEDARSKKHLIVGTLYKRGRPNGDGKTVQRAELRLDGVAGCLRTPGGGSSRQTIMFINGDSIRARLLTANEAARLMGLPEGYQMPVRYNDAYHLAGDGVAVPVVRHLAEHLFEPILKSNAQRKAA